MLNSSIVVGLLYQSCQVTLLEVVKRVKMICKSNLASIVVLLNTHGFIR
jgi:hypothetical protein